MPFRKDHHGVAVPLALVDDRLKEDVSVAMFSLNSSEAGGHVNVEARNSVAQEQMSKLNETELISLIRGLYLNKGGGNSAPAQAQAQAQPQAVAKNAGKSTKQEERDAIEENRSQRSRSGSKNSRSKSSKSSSGGSRGFLRRNKHDQRQKQPRRAHASSSPTVKRSGGLRSLWGGSNKDARSVATPSDSISTDFPLKEVRQPEYATSTQQPQPQPPQNIPPSYPPYSPYPNPGYPHPPMVAHPGPPPPPPMATCMPRPPPPAYYGYAPFYSPGAYGYPRAPPPRPLPPPHHHPLYPPPHPAYALPAPTQPPTRRLPKTLPVSRTQAAAAKAAADVAAAPTGTRRRRNHADAATSCKGLPTGAQSVANMSRASINSILTGKSSRAERREILKQFLKEQHQLAAKAKAKHQVVEEANSANATANNPSATKQNQTTQDNNNNKRTEKSPASNTTSWWCCWAPSSPADASSTAANNAKTTSSWCCGLFWCPFCVCLEWKYCVLTCEQC